MIDVEWNDNAKTAVNIYNDWALENDLGIHAFFEHLTNNGHTQQKTVADAVEQEGEKWTHTFNGDACRVVHKDAGDYWIRFKHLPGSLVVQEKYLKPIKPTISKAEYIACEKMAEAIGFSKSFRKYMADNFGGVKD